MLCDLKLVDELRLCISTICRISLSAVLVVWLAHYVAALNVPKYVTRVMTASWSAPLPLLTVTAGKSASAKPWLWASKRLAIIFCVGLSQRLTWFHSRTAGKRLQFVIIILLVHDLSISELHAIYTLYILFLLLPPPSCIICLWSFGILWWFVVSLKLMENIFVSAECIELAVCCVCLVTAFNCLIPQYQVTCQ